MNRNEYMNTLSTKLKGFPQDLIDEILIDYNEHFNDGIENGKSDEEIIKSLGNIDELVNEMRLAYPQVEKCSNTCIVIDDEDDEDDEDRTFYEKSPNLSLDIEDVEEIEKIVANVNWADIEVTRGNKLKFEFENQGSIKSKMANRPTIHKDGNTLYINLERNRALNFFNNINNNMTFFLELPSVVSDIEINAISGSISIEDLNTNELKLSTASGDINISKINSANLNLNTASGEIEADKLNFSWAEIRSASGDISLDDSECQNIRINSASGDIDIEDLSCEEISLKTASGDIDFKLSADIATMNSTSGEINGSIGCEEFTATTISGDICVKTTADAINCNSRSGDIEIITKGDTNINAASISGDITLDLDNDKNGFKGNVKSVSGVTVINYDGLDIESERNGTHVYGNQGTVFNLQSTSGDFEIN